MPERTGYRQENEPPFEISDKHIRAMKINPEANLILDKAREVMASSEEMYPSYHELFEKSASDKRMRQRLNTARGVEMYPIHARMALYAALAASIPEWSPRSTLVTPGKDQEYIRFPIEDPTSKGLLHIKSGGDTMRSLSPTMHLYHVKNLYLVLGVPDEEQQNIPEYDETFGVFVESASHTYQIRNTPAHVTFHFRQHEITDLSESSGITYKRSAVHAEIARTV